MFSASESNLDFKVDLIHIEESEAALYLTLKKKLSYMVKNVSYFMVNLKKFRKGG